MKTRILLSDEDVCDMYGNATDHYNLDSDKIVEMAAFLGLQYYEESDMYFDPNEE